MVGPAARITCLNGRSPHGCQAGAKKLRYRVLQCDDSEASPARLLGIPNGTFMQVGLFGFEAVPNMFKRNASLSIYLDIFCLIVIDHPEDSKSSSSGFDASNIFQLTSARAAIRVTYAPHHRNTLRGGAREWRTLRGCPE